MSRLWQQIASFMAADKQAVLITLADVRGSAPREAGTHMAMRADGRFTGTIGGGTLEWQALAEAQKLLNVKDGRGVHIPFALGPSLGQCCGGTVLLRIEAFAEGDAQWISRLAEAEARAMAQNLPLSTYSKADARGIYVRTPAPASWPNVSRPSIIPHPKEKTPQDVDARDTGEQSSDRHGSAGTLIETFGEILTPLLLFGAGHVGRALVLALAPLPFHIRWVDPRAGEFPSVMPNNVTPCAPQNVEAEMSTAPSGSFTLIMTHSHALDLALCAAALHRHDLPFIGVIGSATKRARFLSQLRTMGRGDDALARLICPIGIPNLSSKHPSVIAASVAVQLLQMREATRVVSHHQQQGFSHAQF